MGIINATPDSFFASSRSESVEAALTQAQKMIGDGADILDIGGASSRPGSTPPTPEEEIARVVPIIKAIREQTDIPISIDTYRSVVAESALDAGADIVNDISAGHMDANMIPLVAERQVPYIIMHMQGEPETMQERPQYQSVTTEIYQALQKRLNRCLEAGIHDVIVDPGFGFGKTDEHNYQLLRELKQFQFMGCPVLVGLSRKSMIQRVLDVTASESLNGTTALHVVALERGAQILRVHDVKEAKECVKLFMALQPNGMSDGA